LEVREKILCLPTRPVRAAVAIAMLAAALAQLVATAPVARAATGDGSVSDPNVRYVGRWDTSSGTAVGNWAAPYIRTGFTGRTMKIRLRDSANIYVSIDGQPDTFFQGVRGTVNLTPTPLAAGTHSLWVAFRIGAAFQGFVLDPGARTVAPRVSPRLVEYVGDSITFGALTTKLTVSSYSWLTSERLGVEHATIARSGACLVDKGADCFGLNVQYFRTGIGSTQNWDFSRYQANAAVINLGTNDVGHAVTAAQFGAAYLQFLRDIRARRPNATLFAFETFRMRYVPETQAAVRTLNDAGDRNVFFINTEGWLTSADFVDGGHPNDGGHQKIADRLAPIIAARIGA
jgi:lysophospholipase L1-like esterase